MTAKSLRDKILVGGGIVAVVLGTYLPWLKTNPDLPPDAEIPTIYYFGMNAGFEAFDFALLGAAVLVLLLHGVSSRTLVQTLLTLFAGVGIGVFPLYYLSGSTLLGFSATFVPALGWCLTVLGGLFFSIAGGSDCRRWFGGQRRQHPERATLGMDQVWTWR